MTCLLLVATNLNSGFDCKARSNSATSVIYPNIYKRAQGLQAIDSLNMGQALESQATIARPFPEINSWSLETQRFNRQAMASSRHTVKAAQ